MSVVSTASEGVFLFHIEATVSVFHFFSNLGFSSKALLGTCNTSVSSEFFFIFRLVVLVCFFNISKRLTTFPPNAVCPVSST